MSSVAMLLLPLTGITLFLTLPWQGAGYRTVCYYTNWSQYRLGRGKFTPDKVDPSLCTHYIYAFATLQGNRVKAYEWNDLSTTWMRGMIERFMDIKKFNPNAKTLLAVGGWNIGSGPFHQMVHRPEGRQEFADSIVQFLRENHFEGVDIDWEYPANRGSPPEDRYHFTELLTAVRESFEVEAQRTGRPRLLMTAAVAAGKPNIDTAYDIPAISNMLDFISVMTYDLHGSWEDHTGCHSPLYARDSETGEERYLNLAWVAEYWVHMGAPKDKINIGVALYGRTFTLSTSDNGVGAPASGPGNAGAYTREKGFLSYQEICEMERNGGQMFDIPDQRARYMFRGDQWVGYDDKESLQEKVCYIKSQGFGGVMVWSLDLDDFSGTDCNQGPYPLLHAVANELKNPDTTHCVGPGQAPVTTPLVQTTPQLIQAQTAKQPYVNSHPPQQKRVITGSIDFSCYGRKSDFYASPFSCDEYFICANGMAFRVNCAAGLRFNPQTKYCDLQTNVPCILGSAPQPIILTTTTTTTVVTKTTTTTTVISTTATTTTVIPTTTTTTIISTTNTTTTTIPTTVISTTIPTTITITTTTIIPTTTTATSTTTTTTTSTTTTTIPNATTTTTIIPTTSTTTVIPSTTSTTAIPTTTTITTTTTTTVVPTTTTTTVIPTKTSTTVIPTTTSIKTTTTTIIPTATTTTTIIPTTTTATVIPATTTTFISTTTITTTIIPMPSTTTTTTTTTSTTTTRTTSSTTTTVPTATTTTIIIPTTTTTTVTPATTSTTVIPTTTTITTNTTTVIPTTTTTTVIPTTTSTTAIPTTTSIKTTTTTIIPTTTTTTVIPATTTTITTTIIPMPSTTTPVIPTTTTTTTTITTSTTTTTAIPTTTTMATTIPTSTTTTTAVPTTTAIPTTTTTSTTITTTTTTAIPTTTAYIPWFTEVVTPQRFAQIPTTWDPSVFRNRLCEGRPNGLYRDPNNCEQYCECFFNMVIYRPCPKGLAFSEALGMCDYKWRVMECIEFSFY